MNTAGKIAVAAAVTGLLATIAYYWRKTVLIDEIVHLAEDAHSTNPLLTRENLWKYNIWELQAILHAT